MTRINLINPRQLTDQHLLTEYRELPRIFGNVRAAISANKTWAKDYAKKTPKIFVLGTGHMTFFYNKLDFLAERQILIIDECLARSINISFTNGIDYSDIPRSWCGTYTPTAEAIKLSQDRLDERIMLKPDWYNYWSNSILDHEEQPCCSILPNYKI